MAFTQDPPVRVNDDEALRIVRAWRERNPRIVASWWELQDAAIGAVGAPGCVVSALGGKVQYVVANGFLFCKLPSTRVIAYPRPRLKWIETLVLDDGTRVPADAAEAVDRARVDRVETKRSVQYMGVDSVTKRWSVQSLYGGSLCNHVVQGTARDLLVEQMFAVEAAGYPIVLTVHDEILGEVDASFGSADHYQQLMAELPTWAAGLPMAVKAWEDRRYSK